jgi:hypothetical protein
VGCRRRLYFYVVPSRPQLRHIGGLQSLDRSKKIFENDRLNKAATAGRPGVIISCLAETAHGRERHDSGTVAVTAMGARRMVDFQFDQAGGQNRRISPAPLHGH